MEEFNDELYEACEELQNLLRTCIEDAKYLNRNAVSNEMAAQTGDLKNLLQDALDVVSEISYEF